MANEARYMPLYVGNYMAATAHLPAIAHGAYMLLIMNYWQRGKPLPNDDRKLSVIARCTTEEWAEIRDDIAEFFEVSESAWTHDTIEAEIVKARSQKSRPPVPPWLAADVRSRDGDVCAYCETTEGPFHLDHIFPWSKGGKHEASNLTVACASCNWAKGDKTIEEWRGAMQ